MQRINAENPYQKFTKAKEVAGWVGVILILAAHALTTFGIVSPETLVYGVMNLFGAAGIIISSYGKRDFQPVFLNGVWLVVAVIGIIRSLAG
jgi:hypothetical protein